MPVGVKKTDRLVFCWDQGGEKGQKVAFFQKKTYFVAENCYFIENISCNNRKRGIL
jgi:hypothetical protein